MKINASNTLVVVPTYNEALNVQTLLRRIYTAVPDVHVLVVDDSSPDGTGALVEAYRKDQSNLYLLTRKNKEGLAAAYLDGFQWALLRNFSAVIEMDADLSHRPEDLPRFISELNQSDVVIGCRYAKGGAISGWGWTRNAISRGGNTYARAVLGMQEYDLTGGFNGWRANVLRKIDITSIQSRGYAFQVELKYRAKQAGFKLAEIPIQFDNRVHGTSKMNSNIVFEAALRVLQLKVQVPTLSPAHK